MVFHAAPVTSGIANMTPWFRGEEVHEDATFQGPELSPERGSILPWWIQGSVSVGAPSHLSSNISRESSSLTLSITMGL